MVVFIFIRVELAEKLPDQLELRIVFIEQLDEIYPVALCQVSLQVLVSNQKENTEVVVFQSRLVSGSARMDKRGLGRRGGRASQVAEQLDEVIVGQCCGALGVEIED